ncbi:MAG: PAS domain S-box protein [Sandaracinaceae bacterium]|nr:PAS domain S-box protein [Sandaracinaceae bacterium]
MSEGDDVARLRAMLELSRRALDGTSAEELAAEAELALGEALGAGAARALAEGLASVVLDPAREPAFPADPLARGVLELVRAARRDAHAHASEVRYYRTLLDCSSDGICVIDPQGYYLDMNSRGCEMLGYTKDELRRLRIFDLVLPDDPPVDIPALRRGAPIFRRRHIRRKDGSLLMAEIGSQLLPDGGIFGIFRDVTDQVRAERELVKRTERFSQALRVARAGAWEWDIRTGAAYWSEENYALMGLPPGDGMESYAAWLEHVHPDDRPRVEEQARRVLELGAEDVDVEVRVLLPDGSARWMREVGKVVTGASGAPVAMYGIQLDIDAQKQAELARSKAEQRLQQAQRMEAIGRLAGGIAHDFNNLLTVILTGADMLVATGADEGAAGEHLDAIREAARRGAAVTRQLLALSRHAPAAPSALDVSARIRRMVPMLRRLLGETVAIEVSLATDLPIVRMDTGQLDQIVLNLACNGRDAMPRGGTLRLATRAEDLDGAAHVLITVTDTGLGMDEETRARIFEPFFTTKPPEIGTGLGLATVYGIVAQNGGRIDLESEPGRGTCFRAWLPAHRDAEAVDAAPRRASAREPLGAFILLVEDERQVRRLLRRALEVEGHVVLEAASGEEALELVRTSGETFDLLVSDVVLPAMSGPELAARLCEELPELRIVLMSGYGQEAAGRRVGANIALIAKPFTPAELVETIDALLRADHSRRSASTSSS